MYNRLKALFAKFTNHTRSLCNIYQIVSYMPITPFDQICLLYYYNALGQVYKEAYIGL